MKICVTGSSGFIGKALCKQLLKYKHDIEISNYVLDTVVGVSRMKWVKVFFQKYNLIYICNQHLLNIPSIKNLFAAIYR